MLSRLLRLAVPLTLVMALFPLGMGSPVAASDGGGGDPPLPGTRIRGFPLPNLTAEGSNLIRLMAGAFDPLDDPLPRQQGLPLVDEAGLPGDIAQYWLIQVEGTRFPQAQQAIDRAGAIVAGYLHDNTYLVRATRAQRAAIDADPSSRWTGLYQPAWKVPGVRGEMERLLDLTGIHNFRIYVFRADPHPEAVGRALASIDGIEVVEDAGVVVDVRASASALPTIAALPSVEWIDLKPDLFPLNSNARWVNDTGIRDLYAATAPGRLTGAGQTASVADTAVNYTYDLNGNAHVAFRDCNPDGTGCKQAIYTQVDPGADEADLLNVRNNNTGHRKMVAFFDIGETGPNPHDTSSHGSHTGGSIDGDAPPFDVYNGDDGLAPAANHVHQNIGTEGGGLVLPDDLYQLWRQAYRPRDPASVEESSGATGNPDGYGPLYLPLEDPRTHNNSWGAGFFGIIPVPDYGVILDQFVWDHEDMVIVVSNGNAGPDAGSLGSPAIAKNDISSGATANGRQPMVSIDSMASFSSHGPTTDGRYGSDLGTPGQVVVSVKGGTEDQYHVAQGTSMSAPVLTGLATLVRQYFWDGYAAAGGDGFAAGTPGSSRRHNPSAALVKATLANGAMRMRGWYTGDDGTQRALDGQWPSAGQGFGLVNLKDSLFFQNDPTNNWYQDVYRADPDAFPVSAIAATRTYQIHVDPGQPLDVTLDWSDAPNALAQGGPTLINDLNLIVTDPNGATYVGNNMNSRTAPGVDDAETNPGPAPLDNRNPTERVRVLDPAPGDWTIEVVTPPIAMGNQGFALAASGDVSPVGGPGFTPGPPLQRDKKGNPTISGLRVDTFSADTAMIALTTNEPTTATAQVTIDGTPTTFVDSYNEGSDGFPGLDEGTVETSAQYADRPVVGTRHEILITGLDPGQNATAAITVTDLTNRTRTASAPINSPTLAYQADADDTGQLAEGGGTAGWRTGTQLYAGDSAGSALLGAFMFRVPEGAVDPAQITGAAVTAMSSHDWVPRYTDDPVLTVDLLDESVEPGWGTQDYNQIHNAPADARMNPESTHKVGAYQEYAFTLRCSDLEAMKQSLSAVSSGERKAAFRYESTEVSDAVFAMDFGFNRRSQGPELRPRLVLYTADNQNPTGEPCDPATPAPTISNIGVHAGLQPDAVTVSWKTNVPSNSIVLFREQGATEWIQVGTPERTVKVHHVEVFGLDENKEYEFAVRSETCNGQVTTDTNGGQGYDFFRDPVDLGPRTEHAFYDWEAGAEGWTVQDDHVPDPGPDATWTLGPPGASDTPAPDGSRPEDPTENAWHVEPYFDEDQTSLISPPVTFTGVTAEVAFFLKHDTEPTFDFLHIEYSEDGSTWTTVESIDGLNEHYPSFDPIVVQFENPSPGGGLQIRFRFRSDELISSPAFTGLAVDKASLASYPNAIGEEENLPLTGPVPPESAGASGLTPPPTHAQPTAADIAAGTGMCGTGGGGGGQSTLTVEIQGSGQGVVRSVDGGIVCGTGPGEDDCTETYPDGTQVILRTKPRGGSSFAGWGGDCSGNRNQCTVVMNGDKHVTATFSPG